MAATSTTEIGSGSTPRVTTSELAALINSINNLTQTRHPSAAYSAIEITLEEEEDGHGAADITLKDYLDEYSLIPCQLTFFISTSASEVIFDSTGDIDFDNVEMVNGETDLTCPSISLPPSAMTALIPTHTDDYTVRVEFSSELSSGVYFGVLFPDGTYKISATPLVLEEAAPEF
jgi:hypothetical protein